MGNSQKTLQKKEIYASDKNCIETESLGNFPFYFCTVTRWDLVDLTTSPPNTPYFDVFFFKFLTPAEGSNSIYVWPLS